MSEILDLINDVLHAQPPIEEDTMNVLTEFLLLWNIYEARFFGTDFKSTTLKELIASERIKVQHIQPALGYFRQRYTDATGATNQLFETLKIMNLTTREEVEQSLRLNGTIGEAMFAVFTIVYRLRCHLFHGVKEVASLNLQKENFEVANRLLLEVIKNQ